VASSRVPKTQAIERLGLGQRDFLWFSFALFALLGIGIAVVREHHEISHAHERISTAVVALQSAENVSVLLLRAETAQRGFLLTGSEEYLQPYFRVVHEMPVISVFWTEPRF
jgi:CHASE3 domain sensor protein